MQEGTFVLCFMMPFEWPPKKNERIFAGVVAGKNLTILGTPQESLKVEITQQDQTLSYESSKIKIKEFGYFKMAVAWDKNITISMNGEIIPSKGSEAIEIEPKTNFELFPRIKEEFQIPEECIEEEKLFLNTYLDIQNKITTRNKYDLLRASGLLRQMIIDGSPVIHTVNKQYRISISFPVISDNEPISVPGSTYQLSNISPVFGAKEELKKLKLDSFLAIPVLMDDSQSFTVKDIIKVCANVKGGIHFGDPESESEITITDIDQKFSPHFIETSVVLISDIAWSYLKGVKPLVNTILEKYQSN